jgi:hypothetical protein
VTFFQGLGWYTSVTSYMRKRVLQSGTRHTSVILLRLADLLSVPLFVAHRTSKSGDKMPPTPSPFPEWTMDPGKIQTTCLLHSRRTGRVSASLPHVPSLP